METLLIFFTLLVLGGTLPTSEKHGEIKKLWDALKERYSSLNPDKGLESIGGPPPSELENAESIIGTSNPRKCQPCKCGRPRLTPQLRIAGGENVMNVNQYPWIAQLMIDSKAFCGGSLINSRYVLTAAHCVSDPVIELVKNLLTVRLLEHDTSNKRKKNLIDVKVEKIVAHDGYNPKTLDNDIALLRLSRDVEIRDTAGKASPICLPEADKNYTGMDLVVIGWGITNGGNVSSVLQEVSIPAVSNEECSKSSYSELGHKITSNMICAGRAKQGKGACPGDSGGPLMTSNSTSYSLVGIASAGLTENPGPGQEEEDLDTCANKIAPDVYTRVDRYLKWVYDNTMDSCYCSST